MSKPGPPPLPGHYREHPRYELRIGAELRTPRQRISASVVDVGAGGLGLELAAAVEDETPVTAALFLVVDDVEDAATAALELPAHVAWCAETDHGRFRCGLRLGDLETRTRNAFEALVKRAAGR